MFDPFYYECLEQLALQEEARTTGQQVEDVYKLCRWNSRADRHFLATLTRSNQIIIFDCTRLGVEQRDNVLDSQDINEGFLRVFDKATRSKCLNLSELWIAEQKSSLIGCQWKNVESYLAGIDQIVPVALTWSEGPVMLDDKLVDVLLVAFKSNEIACFQIDDNLQVFIGLFM